MLLIWTHCSKVAICNSTLQLKFEIAEVVVVKSDET